MVNDIVIVSYLGAAGNMLRNLMLLSDDVDWPLPTPRYETIAKQYPKGVHLKHWLGVEYRLRYWEKYYNVDLSNDIDIEKFQQRVVADSPVVYMNHSAFFQRDRYHQLTELVPTIYIAPTTEFGLQWQIRSYCEKKTVENLHNFTFETDIVNQREQYCKEHGAEAYYRLNITNFKEIATQRQQELGTPDVPLELLLHGDAAAVLDIVYKKLGIKIDLDSASKILSMWLDCHWPLNETSDWKYYDCIA